MYLYMQDYTYSTAGAVTAYCFCYAATTNMLLVGA